MNSSILAVAFFLLKIYVKDKILSAIPPVQFQCDAELSKYKIAMAKREEGQYAPLVLIGSNNDNPRNGLLTVRLEGTAVFYG